MFDGAYECACSRSYFRYLPQARLRVPFREAVPMFQAVKLAVASLLLAIAVIAAAQSGYHVVSLSSSGTIVGDGEMVWTTASFSGISDHKRSSDLRS
jgi:hypothetical protein